MFWSVVVLFLASGRASLVRGLPYHSVSGTDIEIASSTGLLLKTIGMKVTSIKIDPYMNVDAGTMAPTE